MDILGKWVSRIFGVSMLFLSGFVALETVMRKLFNTSLQGADELAGYTPVLSDTCELGESCCA